MYVSCYLKLEVDYFKAFKQKFRCVEWSGEAIGPKCPPLRIFIFESETDCAQTIIRGLCTGA
jgi:hypothetical protein